MSASQAHVILQRAEIKPHRTDYWMMTDYSRPEFEERLGEICGLYVDPPENVLVVSIDEKTGIQAKSPTKADRPPQPGKPARREHEYTRNGTQCLFACLNVHEGDVLGMPSKSRNRWDLIRFLDHLEEEIPIVAGQKIVAITDNLSTRGTDEVEQWVGDHARWSFQFTPQARLEAQPGRDLLLDPLAAPAQARHLHLRARPRRADARVRRDLQPDRQAVQVDYYRQGPRSMSQRTNRMTH